MTSTTHRLHPDHVKAVRRMGFTHCVIVAKDISVRARGSVEALFRSGNDARRFASTLNRIYGQGAYEALGL